MALSSLLASSVIILAPSGPGETYIEFPGPWLGCLSVFTFLDFFYLCVYGGGAYAGACRERLEETSGSPGVINSRELRMWVLGTEPSPSPL